MYAASGWFIAQGFPEIAQAAERGGRQVPAGTRLAARGPAPPPRKAIIDLDLIQWPAMLVTVAAAWLVGSQAKFRRRVGFWCFLASNVLWLVWGWSTGAWALVVLQVALAIINIRGARKNEPRGEAAGSHERSSA